MQQQVNGLALDRVDLEMLHGLATGENMEHVSCKHIVWYYILWIINCGFPIEDKHILCKKQYHFLTHEVYSKYVPSMHSVLTMD